MKDKEEKKDMKEMRIAHISDSHIVMGGEFQKEAFSQIIEEINNSACDLVVHTGDITDTGLREAYEQSLSLVKSIKKPFVVIPGNHDYRNVGYELFEEYYGELNGLKEGEDYVLIHVDSSIPDRNEGRVGSSKFSWLRNQLIEHSSKKVKIVAVHHHLVPVPKSGTERNVLFNAGDLMDIFRKYDVDLVLSGHRHYPNVTNVDNMVISNAGCMSCRKVRGGDVCSYNQIVITPQEITVRIRRMNIQKTLEGEEPEEKEKPRQDHYGYPRVKSEIFVSEGKKMARIIQIAGTFFSDGKIFEKKRFESAVRKINGLSPDLVIHCGDIVEMGIPQHYEMARTYLERIGAPMIFTPGPRDINYIGYELFPQLVGRWDRQFENPLFRVHGVNSSQYDSDSGSVGRFALKRLEKAIADQEQEISIVFLHHNVVPLPHIREQGLLEDAGDVLKSLCDLKVDLVLSGHSSYPYAIRVGNTIISNANAVSSQYVRSVYGNSFNVIDIYENLINVSEIRFVWGTKRILGIWKRDHGKKKAPSDEDEEKSI